MAFIAFSVLGRMLLQPPVGFVDHYPMVKEGSDVYGASGATIALVRAPWGLIEPTEGAWDSSCIDQQLAWAESQNIRLLYVMECGPAHCVNWVRDKVKSAGESMAGPDGQPQPDPSIFSPVYVQAMDSFIRRAVAYIRDHDTDGRVLGYCNGCEWWYPADNTFDEPDRAAFEKAMIAKYGSADGALAAWGQTAGGKVMRPPVLFDGIGDPDRLGILVPQESRLDVGWCTVEEKHVPVAAGRTYLFEADAEMGRWASGGAYLEIAWLQPGDPRPMRLDHSTRVDTSGAKERLRVEAVAPGRADRAWLLLKSSADGEAVFHNVSFREAGSDVELAPNPGLDPAVGGWHFVPWVAGDKEHLESPWAPGDMRIAYAPKPAQPISERWVDDWFDFTGNAVAEFIGHLADVIREADPGRPIVTYLTFAFGAPFNWDYSYAMNIHPEKVFAARHYEGCGMQLAAADGDYHHITAAIDMVRHLGEPWLIDLQDFTAGVYIGSQAMTNTTLAGIADGARGVVYYCWWGTPDYDFYKSWPEGELESMVGRSKELLAAQAGRSVPVSVAIVHPKVVPFAGRGEHDPARFMLLYKAVRRLGLGAMIVTSPDEAPPGLPLLTVDDVPGDMHPVIRRSTEKGNTPPMFKFVGNDDLVEALASQIAQRLGVTVPPAGGELFPTVGADRTTDVVRIGPS